MPIFHMKPARKDPATGALILECHAAIRVIAVMSVLMGIALFILLAVQSIRSGFRNSQEPLIAITLAGVFAGSGLLMYVISLGTVVLTDKSVTSISPLLGKRSIDWDNISVVTFREGPQWFVLHPNRGQKVKVHVALHGIGDFARMVRERVDDEDISPLAEKALANVTR